MQGWLPIYDTIHGIRGEVNVVVKVDLFSDFNKFRQSSCGVQFFYCEYYCYSSYPLHFVNIALQMLTSISFQVQGCRRVICPRKSTVSSRSWL